jgi:hypothetical protein
MHVFQVSRNARRLVLSGVVAVAAFRSAAAAPESLPVATSAAASRPAPGMGSVRFEGRFVDSLDLIRNDDEGHPIRLSSPGEAVSLSPGAYHWREINLGGRREGSYQAYSWSDESSSAFTVTEGKTTVLKVGGPLKQTLSVCRFGAMLRISHKLRGVGGEEYRPWSRDARPGFEVYAGGKRIGSGSFEYG